MGALCCSERRRLTSRHQLLLNPDCDIVPMLKQITVLCADMAGTITNTTQSASGTHELPFEVESDRNQPREGTAEAVARGRAGGIASVIVTDVDAATAGNVARSIGIFGGAGAEDHQSVVVVSCDDVDAMSTDRLRRLVQEQCQRSGGLVFARATSAHKCQIVLALQRAGHRVAVTGGSSCDLDAFEAADVAIAMGIVGSQNSKEGADAIAMNDNFASIMNGIVSVRTKASSSDHLGAGRPQQQPAARHARFTRIRAAQATFEEIMKADQFKKVENGKRPVSDSSALLAMR